MTETPRSAEPHPQILTSTAWNLLGALVPVLMALITVPVLVFALGAEQFGILTLAWVLLGYFGLFDLGLGRATTKYLAAALADDDQPQVRALFWTSLLLNVVLGVLGGLLLAALAPYLARDVLNVPPALEQDTLTAFVLIAIAIPSVTVTSSLRGVLEARHAFKLLNAVQIPVASLTQVVPLLVLPFSRDLPDLVAAMTAGRFLGAGVFFLAALSKSEDLFARPLPLRASVGPLLRFGGWLTVSNIVGPLMVTADRFFIGSVLSMRAVAYYTTPYEAISRLGLISQGLTRTTFPILSVTASTSQQLHLFVRSTAFLTLVLAPIVGTTCLFAPELLGLWVGEEFARNSAGALQLLSLGLLLNCLAAVPATHLQATGRPDLTAKLHLVELPLYLVALYLGTRHFGIMGAAAAWVLRAGLDGALLAALSLRSMRISGPDVWVQLRPSAAIGLAWIGAVPLSALVLPQVGLRLVAWTLLSVLLGRLAWRRALAPAERARLTRLYSSGRSRTSSVGVERAGDGR